MSTTGSGLSATLPSVAIVTGSLLSGAMLSHALTIPIILDTTAGFPAALIVAQWARTFHYGHFILPPIAIGTLAMYLGIIYSRRRARAPTLRYAMAAALTVAIIPFTLIFMDSTNAALFKMNDEFVTGGSAAHDAVGSARHLVATWGYLHLCRAVMPLGGAVVGFSTLLGELRAWKTGPSGDGKVSM